MRIIVLLIGTLFLCIIAGLILLSWHQEKLIFFPSTLESTAQFQFSGEFTERVFVMNDGQQIHSLQFKTPNSKGLILYFHGNAGSLASWGYVAADFTPLQYDVLIIDYRGYGKSTGSITSETQLHNDAESIYNEMSTEYQEIIPYGRSIGTGVASALANKQNVSMLILETPYYSFPDLVSRIYPGLPSVLLRYQLDNANNIKDLSIPVHLIHGTADELIPYDSSERLKQLGNHIVMHSIDGGQHNNLPDMPQYPEILTQILP